MTDDDIRHSNGARNEKAMGLIAEAEPADDFEDFQGYLCPVCGARIPGGSDEYLSAMGVGEYHTEHLNEGEIEYLREQAEKDARLWDAAARAEISRESNRAVYGDGFNL